MTAWTSMDQQRLRMLELQPYLHCTPSPINTTAHHKGFLPHLPASPYHRTRVQPLITPCT